MEEILLKRAAILILTLILAGAVPAFPVASTRSFLLTYEVRLPSIPPGAREIKVWVPLAGSDKVHQRIRRRVIQVLHPYRVTKDPQYGNDILFLTLKEPLPRTLELAIQYEAEVREDHPPMEKAAPSIPPALEKEMPLYLESNRLMVVDDEIRRLAKAVTAGSRTPAEKAEAIYRYVINRVRYDKETPGWGKGDTLRACQVGAGNCTDFHSLFISLARASGIPARFTIGLPVPEKPEGEIPGYHCWAEFYLPGAGWIPVDASEAWKHREKINYFFGTYDPNRLALSTGRDIRLVPQPASSDPVNIFFYPYVEVDGKSVAKDQIQTKFRFRNLE
ncbi:MAG: transglutaminase domain-containing protein [Candidatus Omnitrophica bacterium]|nr:transglutaminase domain-containing protein [Candidatus Omnitrophota bacterium]